jgi:hypothetical protein
MLAASNHGWRAVTSRCRMMRKKSFASLATTATSGDPPLVPGDLFDERTAHALQDAAFRLVAEAIRVRDRPAIHCHMKTPGVDHASVQIDFNLGDQRRVTVVSLVRNACNSAPSYNAVLPGMRTGGRTTLPVCGACRSPQNADVARVSEMAQAEIDGIVFGVKREFVHKGLIGKGILYPYGGAQRSGKERRNHCVREDAFAPDGPPPPH